MSINGLSQPSSFTSGAVSKGLCGVCTHLKGVKGCFIITNVQAQEKKRSIQKRKKRCDRKRGKKEEVVAAIVLVLSLCDQSCSCCFSLT